MRKLLCLCLVAVCAAHWSAAAHAAADLDRPNFIIFVADDMSWDDCGPYGNPNVKTPNLDRLAREGMRFERAFLTTASCSPSRASLVTGRYPHSTGAGELHMPLPASQQLFTTPLREAGYYTAAAGKWHLGPKSTQQLDRVMEGGGPNGMADWMKVLRERPRDKPFLLWLAAIDPHRPYPRDGGAPRAHDGADVRVPPYLPDTPVIREDFARYYDEIARLDNRIGEVLAELDAQQLADNTVVMFLADNGRPFPRAKTTLYDAGIRTPLLVKYPGRVKAGSSSPSLVSAVDLAPTLVELAGAKPLDRFQGRSFARVLVDDAAAVVREYAFAEHNWHDYKAAERAVRSNRFLYIRNWLPQLTQSPPADVVRSPTFQQMRQMQTDGSLASSHAYPFQASRPPEELYDVEADPESLHNLAADPDHAETLRRMRETLDAWQRETADEVKPDQLSPDRFDRLTGEPL